MTTCAFILCGKPFEGGPSRKYDTPACRVRASALRKNGGLRLPRGRPHPLLSRALAVVRWAERIKPATAEAWGVNVPRRRAGTGRLYDKVVHF